MSETAEGWARVLTAFEDWISYEAEEFGPWTGYFNLENLRSLTSREILGWMHKMQDELIPGRVDMCQGAAVALEDFLPYMPGDEARNTVRSMIDLTQLIQDSMLGMSDQFGRMMEEYKTEGLEEAIHYLRGIIDTEEEIRHQMSLFSQGFAKLGTLGLEIPEEML
ncbi:MAG: hypothetical protein BAJATHORv1_10198 [Candidatus Thorarchaeota archaeon]|nr:MAG: hypothetical protein BAJATHORv1_10198 [Candidatus Thorarchaeota archaeon]